VSRFNEKTLFLITLANELLTMLFRNAINAAFLVMHTIA
jgi:hypothetical protein